MFELPEYLTLARQMNQTITGKVIRAGHLGNSSHKFVWYNREPDEFERLTSGKRVGEAQVRGRWLFLPLDPGYVLLLGECGGKMLYHIAGSKLPKKYHLYIAFEDDSFLTVTTQMWGAMELYEAGQELEREYVKGMRATPVEPDFTYDYWKELIEELLQGKKRSVKSLLTQDQLVPGLGNAVAQDIMFRARLHPRRPIGELDGEQRRALYDAIQNTVRDVIEGGGRYDEYDLNGKRGGYVRVMDKNALGRPCPVCGGEVKKIQYLGGACYLCPSCQKS
jgi:formamidopyrimidine-DNA glycosylase